MCVILRTETNKRLKTKGIRKMNTKQMMAQMQIEAELAATLAKLTVLSQHIDPASDYGKALKTLKENLSKNADSLAANAE